VIVPFYASWPFWLYLAAWLPYTLLIITYGFGSPWYSSAIGRSLMLTKVVIVLVLTNILTTYLVGDVPPAMPFGSVTLLVVAVIAGWYQFVTILGVQRQGRQVPDHPLRRATDVQPRGRWARRHSAAQEQSGDQAAPTSGPQ
jgi:hypothetical protein